MKQIAGSYRSSAKFRRNHALIYAKFYETFTTKEKVPYLKETFRFNSNINERVARQLFKHISFHCYIAMRAMRKPVITAQASASKSKRK